MVAAFYNSGIDLNSISAHNAATLPNLNQLAINSEAFGGHAGDGMNVYGEVPTNNNDYAAGLGPAGDLGGSASDSGTGGSYFNSGGGNYASVGGSNYANSGNDYSYPAGGNNTPDSLGSIGSSSQDNIGPTASGTPYFANGGNADIGGFGGSSGGADVGVGSGQGSSQAFGLGGGDSVAAGGGAAISDTNPGSIAGGSFTAGKDNIAALLGQDTSPASVSDAAGAIGGGGQPVLVTDISMAGEKAGSTVAKGVGDAAGQLGKNINADAKMIVGAGTSWLNTIEKGATDLMVRFSLVLVALVLLGGAWVFYSGGTKIEVVPKS